MHVDVNKIKMKTNWTLFEKFKLKKKGYNISNNHAYSFNEEVAKWKYNNDVISYHKRDINSPIEDDGSHWERYEYFSDLT